MAALILAALILHRSFALTALSDWIQGILLLSATLCFIPRIVQSRGRLRLFWALLASGMALWFSYQVMWSYFEVWLRADVPDLCAGDIILFLHIVPLMAALALRPHAAQDEYSTRLRRLDFALMMVWWMYLYVFAVMAWQYVVPDIPAYNNDLNLLYLIEKIAFLIALFVCWLNSRGRWKLFYANLFGASLTYACSSYVANWAIGRKVYYSGSLYDIPLVASMAWITLIGLRSKEESPASARSGSTSHGVWLARVGMIAVFSLPLLAAWALLEPAIPPRIRSFRLVLTLGAALFMGIVIFVRQRLLDRELLRLLTQSRESFANLKRLQAQITESEKLASIGQLVGGAAHELNNPITAMLGYCDLLVGTSLNPDQRALATKIGQHIRRTRSLVASLLSFAKQGPALLVPVDLKTILQTAVKLSEPLSHALKIEFRADLQPDLPPVLGDSNQLLQVCVQILSNAANAADQSEAHTVIMNAEHRDGLAVITVFQESSSEHLSSGNEASDPAAHPIMSSLGLTACRGILQQHRGKISWQPRKNAGIEIRVEIPVIPVPERLSVAGVQVMWQPQPSA
ncbi:MAG TPA: histidine kinase dimerization/phospho-acceptor domain-containing protein [Candidatus Aquilonibacter sp.]|jgi:signal transduction histidine kinase|nr:histidine kinase dimerization/phospho-acceptor domain-containing protein [Candidatus Aquilonibacter sp.]